VLTNVPGPREPLYMAGRKIDKVMFWVPQSGHLGLGISILSYAGSVMLGIATDAGLVPDPERIVDNFNVEFEAMLEASKQASKPRSARRPARPAGARRPPARKAYV
jgi:diacylglycerol O-acyltransferase / wax synthase